MSECRRFMVSFFRCFSATVVRRYLLCTSVVVLLASGAALAAEGFLVTQGEGRGEDLTRIYDGQGNLVKSIDCYGQALLLDKDGSVFIGESERIGGSYAILYYPYLGAARWGAAQEYCSVRGKPRVLARDPSSGALYIGIDDLSRANVFKCARRGEAPVYYCGCSGHSDQMQDLEVGPDGKLWMGVYGVGYLRFPVEGGSVPDLTIVNGGKAGGFAFGPAHDGGPKPVLYGSVNGTLKDFGWYDCESGAQLGKLFSEADEKFGNYCMTLGPDRNGDGVADIYIASAYEVTRIYDGKNGAQLGKLGEKLPNLCVSGVASVAPVAAPVTALEPHPAERIRVACVGDSITRGEGISNRGRNSYPAQLGRLLGEKYEVRNFGFNGARMARHGYKPYWNLAEFKMATDYAPQIVIIMLGTNDAYPEYWREDKERFAADSADMAGHFLGLPSNPKVWLCLPPPILPALGLEQMNNLDNGVRPILRQVAAEKRVPVVDMYRALNGKPELMPDAVHPTAEGARLIAEEVYRAITAK